MLVSEIRIPMPLTVSEYQRAQRYTMARISREHTQHGQGVIILDERPYIDPHTGHLGRYTRKYLLFGKRLPSFIRALIPTSVLRLEERSWNAYPLTRSVYTIPLLGNRFCMDLRTVYLADRGETPNAHGLSDAALAQRRVDLVNIVTDPYPAHKYKKEEDLTLVQPATGRGPLSGEWLHTWRGPLVTSYKLALIQFHSWPRFPFLEQRVQNWAWSYLRELQLVGHRKAVAWQDAWMALSDAQLDAYEADTRQKLETRWHQLESVQSTGPRAQTSPATHTGPSDALGPPPPPLLLQ